MFRSPLLRKKDVEFKGAGGIKAFCLLLYRSGNTYSQIAERTEIPLGTLSRNLAKWRRDDETYDEERSLQKEMERLPR